MFLLTQPFPYVVGDMNDQSAHNIKQSVEFFAKHMAHARTQMALVAILTHGDSDGRLYGSDGQTLNVADLRAAFTASDGSGHRSSPNQLFGKPKILLLVACRGGMSCSQDITFLTY